MVPLPQRVINYRSQLCPDCHALALLDATTVGGEGGPKRRTSHSNPDVWASP